ncbi:unnamed protein product [Heligmosomoides polygyrus]|uniref:Reverse transcriptase domain-containing protein n=1 Tax=Heligmosomoides polygyrus TaxID=6339 RepID=A0A183GJ94_HELPZ|nr:unnamed protein product [Heligmosomoides polygyrus]
MGSAERWTKPCEQTGYRRGLSTIDHTHTITKLIKVWREQKLTLCLTFINLKKAFDSVETEAVLEALLTQGAPTGLYGKRILRFDSNVSAQPALAGGLNKIHGVLPPYEDQHFFNAARDEINAPTTTILELTTIDVSNGITAIDGKLLLQRSVALSNQVQSLIDEINTLEASVNATNSPYFDQLLQMQANATQMNSTLSALLLSVNQKTSILIDAVDLIEKSCFHLAIFWAYDSKGKLAGPEQAPGKLKLICRKFGEDL